MLSQKSRYGLRALISLAKEGTSLSVATIAEREGISRRFLENILLELKSHGLVRSRRGKMGGYELARDPCSVSYAEIIRALEGPLALAPCASRTAYRACADCQDPETCEVRRVLLAVRDASAHILEHQTLADTKGVAVPGPIAV